MGSRILVVDDSPTIRRVVSLILERHGYDPALANDGEDAMEVLKSGEVKADLVLLDFVMPRMNGYQFCRALRERAELASTPVILMSAKADRIREQFVQQTGAIDAITKPFEPQALVAVVENALRRVNTQAQARTSSARLPDPAPSEAEPFLLSPPAPGEDAQTKRTHVAQIIATKLAHIVSRVLGDKPDATPGELSRLLADRLSNEAILEMVELVREVEKSRRDAIVLAGDLGVVPIGAILQLLQVEAQTGVLTCKSETAEVTATFRNGLIDLVQSSGAGDEFRLGRFFVEEGILSAPQIDQIIKRSRPPEDDAPKSRVSVKGDSGSAPVISVVPETVKESAHDRITMPGSMPAPEVVAIHEIKVLRPRLLGAILLESRLIDEAQLKSALTRQSSELLYEVIRWPKGRFEFRRGTPDDAVVSARLAMPVASVVMEGFRRVDEWRVLERTIGSFESVILKDDEALGAIDPKSIDDKERRVLDAATGDATVSQIIAATSLSSFDACRTIASFLEARVLRKRG